MLEIRRSADRGRADHGWLRSFHTFSFADYYDPEWMGYGPLLVINDDRVAPGEGFGKHGHRDMEIITYILAGALEHRDSMGNGSVIRPGDVQRMSAGTGVAHSEFNPSPSESVHLLQIWIMPRARNLSPSYEQKAFSEDDRRNRLRLVASDDGRDGSVTIQQDASLYAAILNRNSSIEHSLSESRYAWLQVARGSLNVNGHNLTQGDGAAISREKSLKILASEEAELLLFDL